MTRITINLYGTLIATAAYALGRIIGALLFH
jgi:hypothetical protein